MTLSTLSRRRLLEAFAAAGGAASAAALMPGWSAQARSLAQAAPASLSGPVIDLSIGRGILNIDGRRSPAIAVNGSTPAPLLRWREGEEVTLNVTNTLDTDSSIHWHGILLPFQMDGVPGVSFPGIAPGETFTYRFRLRQSGTYWYHSHSGLQEQAGHYGPIIVDPAGADPVSYDREHVIVLGDWTFQPPHELFDHLKKSAESLNFNRRTAQDFLADAREDGLGETMADRAAWGRMRMMRTDLADVTGVTYDYLINGRGPADNWTGLFRPGERVRLRIINAAAMTLFNLRIPGLAMTVVQADGQAVRPVETDEFQIGVAETYDVIVTPREDRAYTLMAETADRSGYARATLAPRAGMTAEVPELRPTPLLTMRDMGMNPDAMGGGMDHGSMTGAAAGGAAMDHGAMNHGAMNQGSMDHGAMNHGAMNDDSMEPSAMGASSMAGGAMGAGSMGAMTSHDHAMGPGVANTAMSPVSRLHEPGLGLGDVTHRALSYDQLESLEPNDDPRAPGREMEIHLTSNMERYMWSFDGVRFSEVTSPIVFQEGERLRMHLVNDTMMNHPIHLHGMFFELVNGHGRTNPRKHTVIVKPGERLSIDITADEPGDWAFHCHLLYHMHAGMMQVVSVRPPSEASSPPDNPHGGHAMHGMEG
jgi:CopA family copper-resistance protein